jgi:hypothetical protein
MVNLDGQRIWAWPELRRICIPRGVKQCAKTIAVNARISREVESRETGHLQCATTRKAVSPIE